ncbi:FlgO family outer membrane protein [Planctobacterium marinum]
MIKLNLKINLKSVGTAAILLSLAGCESTFFATSNSDGEIIENPYSETASVEMSDEPQGNKRNKSDLEVAMLPAAPPPQHQITAILPVPKQSFRPAFTHKALSDYAEQMTMNLLQRTKHITPNSRIGIASFVDFSQGLQSPTVLGNRLAESFITELQSYGLAIVDFKAMDAIQVTPQGDLFFERSGPRGEMQFVLTGTMHRSGRGVEVNVRIVNVFDKVTVASTKGFIPHFIVASLTPDYILVESD